MPRWVYHSLMTLAVLTGGFLVALPLWDHWYYRTALKGHAAATSPVPASEEPAGEILYPELLEPLRDPRMEGGLTVVAAGVAAPLPRTVTNAGPDARSGPAPSSQPAQHQDVTATGRNVTQGSAMASLPAASPLAVDGQTSGRGSAGGREPAPVASSALWLLSGTAAPTNASSRSGTLASPSENETKAQPSSDVGDVKDTQNSAQDTEPAPSEMARVALVPSRTALAPGETLLLRVVLIASELVSSVPFHLRFNPDVLQYMGAREGQIFLGSSLQPLLLASVNPNRPWDLAVGLSLIESSGLLNQSGDILLLEFKALGSGRSDLLFERASVRGSEGQVLPTEFIPSTVTVR